MATDTRLAFGFAMGILRTRRPSAAFRQLPGRCTAVRRIRARPSVNAHPKVICARESTASRLAWRNN